MIVIAQMIGVLFFLLSFSAFIEDLRIKDGEHEFRGRAGNRNGTLRKDINSEILPKESDGNERECRARNICIR